MKGAQNPATVAANPHSSQHAIAGVPTPVSVQKMPLKYDVELRALPDCPPSCATPRTTDAYRFAHAELAHPNNSLPVAKINPKRNVHGRPVTTCCTAFALSVFDSLPNLRAKALQLKKNNPNILKMLGDKFIKLNVSPSSGLSSLPAASGHFELFESDTFDLLASIAECGPLL